MEPIRFGTDGWRALIARDFTFERLGLVAEAIARYLGDTIKGRQPLVIVGYDTRFLSEEFALEVARILAGHDYRVLLSDRDAPTPALSHAILHHHADGACIITASHNPPEYSGIKFQPDNASPAMPEVTEQIEKHLRKVERSKKVKRAPADSPLIEHFSPREPYLEALKSLVDLSLLQQARLHVWVNCLYGTSRGYLDTLLREVGCQVDVLNAFRDPLFGGGMPEPSEPFLKGMAERVTKSGAVLGVATDGDADRFGFVDRSGNFVPVNDALAALLWYLTETRFKSGSVVRTIATTRMLDRIAEYRGLHAAKPTPIGFKYLGYALRTTDAVFAGEESGGMAIKGHIPEKDGLAAALLACEMIASTGSSFKELLNTINSAVGRLYSKRVDLRLPEEAKVHLMEALYKTPPHRLGGLRVRTRDLETDGVCITMKDESWFLIRPSGTEPLVRVYLEAPSPERLAELEINVQGLIERRLKS